MILQVKSDTPIGVCTALHNRRAMGLLPINSDHRKGVRIFLKLS